MSIIKNFDKHPDYFKELVENVNKVAETEGFIATWETTTTEDIFMVMFSKYSPCGQDFFFSVDVNIDDDLSDVATAIEEYYDGFDISTESYLWLDEDGHGTNGAPYEMIDVYNDMATCKDYICKLANAITDYDNLQM